MKTVKIIVITISVLVLALLLTGLLVKNTTYTTEVLVNKPIAEVFTVFNDIDKTKNWIPEFKSVEVIQENQAKVGSIYKVMLTNTNGKNVILKEKVLAFVPNKKVVLNYYVEGMLKKNAYTFTSEGNTTKIVQESTCRSTEFLMSCVFPFFKSKFKAQDQGYLNSFKAYAESVNN